MFHEGMFFVCQPNINDLTQETSAQVTQKTSCLAIQYKALFSLFHITPFLSRFIFTLDKPQLFKIIHLTTIKIAYPDVFS